MTPFHKSAAILLFLLAPASASAATATLSWDVTDPNDAIDGWRIYYDRDQAGPPYDGTEADQGPSPVDVPVSAVADRAAPSFELSGLESCQRYWFAVTAYNAAGESDFSAEVPKTVVAKPTNVAANSAAPGQVTVSWSGLPPGDPGSITGFQLYYDLDSGDPYSAPGSPVALPVVTSHTFDGLTRRAAYYFVVEAFCSDGSTKRSDEVSVVVQDVPNADPGPSPTNNTPAPMNNTSNPPPVDEDVMDDEYLPPEATGCGCQITGQPPASGLAVLGLLILGVSRRRTRR